MEIKLTKNLILSEYLCKCGKCKYSEPSEKLRKAVLPTAVQNQILRDYVNMRENRLPEFEIRFRVNSGIRCPEHNRKSKGKEHSRHLPIFYFRLQGAGDLSTTDISARKLRKYTKEAWKKGIISGGCGLYRTFVHSDTSSLRYWGRWKFWKKP